MASLDSNLLSWFICLCMLYGWVSFLLKTPLAQRHLDDRLKTGLCCLAGFYVLFMLASPTPPPPGARGHLLYLAASLRGDNPTTPPNWAPHAPLYYLLAQPFLFLGYLLSSKAPMLLLRMVSVCMMLTFTLYGVALAGRLLAGRTAKYLAALLLATSPLLVFASGRISPDSAYFLLMLAGLYHLLAWQESRDNRHIWCAVFAAALGFATKSAAIALCLLVGIELARQSYLGNLDIRALLKERHLPRIALAVLVLCVGLNIGRGFIFQPNPPPVIERPQPLTPPGALFGDMWGAAGTGDKLEELVYSATVSTLAAAAAEPQKQLTALERFFSKPLPVISMSITYMLALLYAAATTIWRVTEPQPLSAKWHLPMLFTVVTAACVVLTHGVGSLNLANMFYLLPLLIAVIARSAEWHGQQGRVLLGRGGVAVICMLAGSGAGLVLAVMFLKVA